jgi:hypothetical protein
LELSKNPKFNLTAENLPKTTHQDKEWSIKKLIVNKKCCREKLVLERRLVGRKKQKT